VKYDLSNSFEIKKFATRCKKLIKKRAKVDLTEPKGSRSGAQNRYQHVLFNLYCLEAGETFDYTKQVIYKILVNRDIFGYEVVITETGEILTAWKSTAELTTEETSIAIERFRNHSASLGFYLPSADEYLANQFYFDKEIENRELNVHK